MNVQPGIALGRFAIGMPLNEGLALCQTYPQGKPQIDVLYDPENLLSADIVLLIRSLGLKLRFDPISQRLHMIDVYEPRNVEMRYAGTSFGGGDALEGSRSLLQLYKLFGPTYPGKFDAQLQSYLLHYRGLCLRFPIPPKFHHLYNSDNDLVLELPDGTSPEATQVIVYGGEDITKPTLPHSPATHDKQVTVLIKKGDRSTPEEVGTHQVVVTMEGIQKSFKIGASVQDIETDIGTRVNMFVKQGNKMEIHRAKHNVENLDNNSTVEPFQPCDYFYNFFHFGMDLLIDGETHRVKKVVLMTNCPGQPDFGMYMKCNFKLIFETPATLASSSPGKKSSKKKKKFKDTESVSGTSESKCVVITAGMKWDQVEELLGSRGRPMVRDPGAIENPFGASFLYAYDSCVFEVLKNGYIISVTIF